MNNPGWGEKRPDLLRRQVEELVAGLDRGLADEAFKTNLKHALLHLSDLKFALNESSIVAVTDRRGLIQYVNDKFCSISGYSREELMGRDHRIINSGHHGRVFMRELWRTIGSGQVWRGEIKNRAKDGTYYWVHTTIVPLLGEDAKPYQYLAIRNEVTELKRVQEELRHTMNKVMHVQEEERKRLSRELHDGIGQSLFSLLIQMDRLLQERADDKLEAVRSQVSELIEDVRSLAWELRPSVLDDLGVVPAIRTCIENFTEHYGITVQAELQLKRRLGPERETTIYRTIQEALTNIGKYAHVETARVSVLDGQGGVRVQIEDEGAGFVREPGAKGVGLRSMEERAHAVGGRLSVDSRPGGGTCVTLTLP
ncbi:PAS domain S-box protein [Paenibacillus sabuli]|uniref:PAS domain S-box protein n=1 Tax=Paenibacillus sabuli TaxID=2772509 RepID=UPI0037C6398E